LRAAEERAREERRAAEERAREERRAAEERAREERRAAEERAKARSDAEDSRAAAAAAAAAKFNQRMIFFATVIALSALIALVVYLVAPSNLAKAWIAGVSVIAFLASLVKLLDIFS
jgi:VIT1/CCC1 family predicted Fe2+/Mn2+ transporter